MGVQRQRMDSAGQFLFQNFVYHAVSRERQLACK
jgi:hypothetical protein